MIQLARGLSLDPDYIGGGTFALLAKKGWGKTYAMRVLAEEMHKAHVPFVALDPMDAFWGLRASKDGKANGGLDIPIFGGEHADVPLEPTAGALMADLVVKEGLSMVLSIAHFGSRAAERRFALDFLGRLYRTNRDLVHLLIDEADLFAPQKPQAGDQQLLGETENIVRRGRNKGIGITLGTQRPAVLNKDVLTQVDGLIVGRMLGPNDRNAIDAWVGAHGDANQGKAIKDELPDLGTGECWVWIPEQSVLEKVTIREARTFDSSPTRKRNAKARRLTLTDVDLGAIQAKMADTIERAKAEDPKELRKQIAELKKELAKKPDAPVPEPVEVKVPILDPASGKGLTTSLDRVEGFISTMQAVSSDIRGQLDRAEKLVSGSQAALNPRQGRASAAPPPVSAAPARRQPPAVPQENGMDPPTGPQQRVLNACAWLEAVGFLQPSKIQVGFIAGYRVGKKVGGTYGNILGQLRANGWLDYPSTGEVELTTDGRTLADDPGIEHTTAGLQAAVMERLTAPERRVLQPLIDAYPESLTKLEVGAEANYAVGEKVGGTFGNILGKLRSLGLIDYPATGLAVALPVLFLEGR